MTVFLPLEAHTPLPPSPSFLSRTPNAQAQLQKVIQTILKAKRIVVVCGAGISVQAGIPDFRSPEGLFRTLKRDNPREVLASGKDLFDASVFNSEHTTSLFCQMIAQLSKLSQDAKPTAFHRVLRALDNQGKLLRVYTQNIDAIEQKCGLSFGVPGLGDKRGKHRSKGKASAKPLNHNIDQNPSATPTRFPSPPTETPRCIPLHGTLQAVHCQVCMHSFPLQEHLSSLATGQPPQCPECTSLERTRQLIGKRPRGIGKLRPSVVLYNEAHKDGEGVGEIVRKDLMGSKGRSGADLLLVVGTSLRVPGTKRMVREFSKAVRSRSVSSSVKEETGGSSCASTPSSSARPSPSGEEEPTMKAVYLNLDFPVPTREWEGVFDVWLQGDAQSFAQVLHQEIEKHARAKELAIEKKRKRDEEAALAAKEVSSQSNPAFLSTPKPPKRKFSSDSSTTKRRKFISPPSPPESPPRFHPEMPPLEAGSSSPLVIRIPPRLPREVCCVDIPPVALQTPRRPSIHQLPPTPEETPPFHFKTSALRYRLSTPPPPPTKPDYICDSFVNIDLSDDEYDHDALPISCIRSTQIGLNPSGY